MTAAVLVYEGDRSYCVGVCYCCREALIFNPRFVPCLPSSVTDSGKSEPVCRTCIERANPRRVEAGHEPVNIHPEAYEPTKEGYLP